MKKADLQTIFDFVAKYAAERRSTDGNRGHAPLVGYDELRLRLALPEGLPGAPGEEVIRDLIRFAEPGLGAMTGPRFHGWVIGASNPIGVAADWLTSVWGQNAANHLASPAASAAEEASGAALLELLDLPREAAVGFVTGATMANFTALGAARNEVLRRVGWNVETHGLFGAPEVNVVLGAEAHSTVFAALKYLGFGTERVVKVAVDANGAARGEAFTEAVAGISGPTIVILQAGHINSGAFDPFQEIIPAAKAIGAWVHVDGAFGLWARLAPTRAYQAKGLELADSWAVDGHKWLQTPYDCGYAIVRDKDALVRAMQIPASYLPGAGDGVRNPSELTPELSRRARGFATWAILRHLGREGVSRIIERGCTLAALFAQRLVQEPDIEIMNDVNLNQVAVRLGADLTAADADRLTHATIARIQRDGVCFVGGARWKGAAIIRISVSGEGTTESDVEASCEAIVSAWKSVRLAHEAGRTSV